MSAKQNKLSDSVEKIPHVGAAWAKKLSRLGIKTVEDLLGFLPRDVLDLSSPRPISRLSARFGEKIALWCRVEDVRTARTPRRRLWLVEAALRDGTGEVSAIWFNQPYLRNFFKEGKKYLLYGEFLFDFQKRRPYLSNPQIFPERGIYPIYPQTEGLTSRQISLAIKSALERGYRLEEFLPALKLNEALSDLHFPQSVDDFARAKKTFIFKELVVFILANLHLRRQNSKHSSFKVDSDRAFAQKITTSLPFRLTADQLQAVEDILADFGKGEPMNRLLQGDVGSGKTAVALVAALAVIRSGYKAAWLAPTEILAHQHVETAEKLTGLLELEECKVDIGLVTSAVKRKRGGKLALGGNLLIGTHALLQKDIEIDGLALVIIDEQHRFGVEQRARLIQNDDTSRTGKSGAMPHLLSLSATPIPRTLAHTVFGNLDISTIKTKPRGRKPVKTYLVPESKRLDSYKFVDSLAEQGQQAFVVCPLIEPPSGGGDGLFDIGRSERKAAEAQIKSLKSSILGKRKIALLHGKMKSAEKEQTMKKMRAGEIDILVSTSVVEVGVDISRATAMIIEDAERFGLSQLHQFRGRVGRGGLQSYCLLFCKNLESEKTRARLKAFVQNFDGFELAEMDLRQRGAGALLGVAQSGFKGVNPLWFGNTALLDAASKKARQLIGELEENPLLEKKVLEKLETKHLE